MSLRRLFLAVALAGGVSSVAQAQCDRRFTLVNQSGSTINQFFFGSSAQRNWGVDQLGSNVLPSGRSIRYETRHSGRNDFKVVWANGATAELMNIDICATSEIVATQRGIVAR
ncbi:hypothetical protein KTR66_17815 [Roseococcus sp. SDR]|uniref:hypothetical protein n=1 Tax=Roseococcus sp. SDR TaxID=2835532 RepID=UPI001BCC5582|nr:hypothetical protein [Roseococcus sp. SDR]MBS7791862.1 hypothetical protein [Roseococcus sp. SDR]MBV1847176.1 hypothetical protein [Roseococcus sp. SDR]